MNNKKYYKERNDKILLMLKQSNSSFVTIGKKYNITPQRVQQIAKDFDIQLHGKNHEEKDSIVRKIKEDMPLMSYKDIRAKYKEFEGHNWKILQKKFKKMYGETIYTLMKKERDALILQKYSSGDKAIEVINSDDLTLKSPLRFTKVRDVYRISIENGYRKYPGIGSRAGGGIFERKKVLDLIVKMREEKKMKFKDITIALNKKGLTTIQGKEFKMENVIVKYHRIKSNNPV